ISRRVMPLHSFFGEPRIVNITVILAGRDVISIGLCGVTGVFYVMNEDPGKHNPHGFRTQPRLRLTAAAVVRHVAERRALTASLPHFLVKSGSLPAETSFSHSSSKG